jgi:hypothetical protein
VGRAAAWATLGMSEPPTPLVPPNGNDRFLLAFGGYGEPKYAVEETALGKVAVSTRAKVVILVGDEERELSASEAYELLRAISHAAYAADQWGKELAGHNRLRVRLISAGAIEATYHGETRQLRLCAPRKHHRTCRACGETCSLFWCDEKGPGHFVEVCDPCARRLGAEPAVLRPAT